MYVCLYVSISLFIYLSGKGMAPKQMHHELELGLVVVLPLMIAI